MSATFNDNEKSGIIIVPDKTPREKELRKTWHEYQDIPNGYPKGYVCLTILPELNGKKLDDAAKSLISAFEPYNDFVEIARRGQTLEGRPDKHITVFLKDDTDIIVRIEQWRTVSSIPKGVTSGGGLQNKIRNS